MNKELAPYKVAPKVELPQINLKNFRELLKKESGLSARMVYGHGAHTVFVLPDAKQELFTYFKFGKGYRATNRDEQKAKLYGHRFIDENNHYVFLISRAAYIYPAVRGRTFVATSGKNEDDFMEHRLRTEQMSVNQHEARYNTDKNGHVIDIGVEYYGKTIIVGNTHTHSDFGCNPSARDLAANESTADIPYAYLICDPIREDFSAMVGVKAEPARIVFLDTIIEEAPRNVGYEIGSYAGKNGTGISQIATECRAFLKNPGVRGGFRMFYDANGKAHVKFHARFSCTRDSADEFELAKQGNAR